MQSEEMTSVTSNSIGRIVKKGKGHEPENKYISKSNDALK